MFKFTTVTSIVLVALVALSSNANAKTHCTDYVQASCTSKVLCKWKEGHKAGTPQKSDKTKTYKRDSKASCRKDNKAINAFLISKFVK